jgi:hypothetical protein
MRLRCTADLMLKRILLAYVGAIVLPICFLLLAFTSTMGGHSLMYSVLFGSPIGIAAALWYSDTRQRYLPLAALLRSFVGLLLVVSMILVLSRIDVSPFWTNAGWVLIPVCGPWLAAVISGLILTARVRLPT